jgi:anaerobic ribonucleoside-triphosphate reductase
MLRHYKKGENIMTVVSEKERGLGVKFDRIRRITGYLVGTMDTWNSAKRAEERDRVKHA